MKQVDQTELQRLRPFWNELRNARMWGDFFQELRHELCLGEISASFEVWHIHAVQAFQQVQAQGKHDLQLFQQFLQSIETNLQQLPDQRVKLWLPSSVQCPEGTVMHSLGHPFEYCTEEQARNNTHLLYEGPEPQGRGRPQAEQLATSYWTVEVDALGPEDAWDQISHAFAMLRAGYEYTCGLSSRSFNTLGLVQQSHFVQPAWVYGESTSGTPRTFFFVEQNLVPRPSPQQVLAEALIPWQDFLIKISQRNQDFQDWRQGVLSLWLSARDSYLEHDALFGCWQTLELLTLAEDEGGATATITKRMKILMQDSTEFNWPAGAFLKRLGKVRNNLTHNRMYATDYHALEAARYLTLVGVQWMLALDPVFSTLAHVGHFFSVSTKGNAALLTDTQSTDPVLQAVALHFHQKRNR